MERLAVEYIEILYRLQEEGLEDLSDYSKEQRKPYLHLRALGLINYGYIDLDSRHFLRAEISDDGKDYLAALEDQDKKFNKTHTVAVLALILSIISLLIDTIQLTPIIG